MSTTFDRDTTVTPTREGSYRAEIDPRWWVVRGPHGGYLASILLRALTETLQDQARPVRSLTVHYLAAPQLGTVEVDTSIERAGRTATSMTARMSQNDKPVANALATFSAPWTGFTFDDAVMPEAALPPDGARVPPPPQGVPPFLGNFDMRWAVGDPPMTGSDRAAVGGWFRLSEPQVADEHVVATLMDAWPPAVFPRTTEPIVAPTLDLTIHFRRALPLEGARPDDLYLGVFGSKLAHDGFFEEDGELWSKDGILIAQSRQLALALTRPPD